MPDEHDDEDRSIVDALSALGWVEEDENAEQSIVEEEDLQTQVKQLNEDLKRTSKERDELLEALYKARSWLLLESKEDNPSPDLIELIGRIKQAIAKAESNEDTT